jgi:hypothetical protein
MLNMQPDMNVDKQIRKGQTQRTAAFDAGDYAKARYIDHCIGLMRKSIEQGKPRPWSEFQPMIDEEFS